MLTQVVSIPTKQLTMCTAHRSYAQTHTNIHTNAITHTQTRIHKREKKNDHTPHSHKINDNTTETYRVAYILIHRQKEKNCI